MTRQLTALFFIAGTLALCMPAAAHCGKCGVGDKHAGDDDKKEHRHAEARNVVQLAASDARFSTLVTAVKEAGLVETLSGDGPFTIFAPTNEAFAKLPEGTLETLLKPENRDKLVAILTYHVVPGKVMAKDVAKLTEAKTAQGSMIRIDVSDGVKLNDSANVTQTDLKATNGVIHVIDTVILPPSDES